MESSTGTFELCTVGDIYGVCKKGGGAQYHGKKSDVMVRIPANVKKWAEYAFKLQAMGFEGATETGWKRARQLATRESIPIEDLRYMHAWFSRHVHTSYPGFKSWADAGRPKESKWHKKRSIISWATWAGDAGFRWVNSKNVLSLLSKHYDKEYKKIKPR